MFPPLLTPASCPLTPPFISTITATTAARIGREKEFGFRGKITYRFCRKPVFPPSHWNAELALRSAKPPKAR